MTKKNHETCSAKVLRNYRFYVCGNRARVTEKGWHFCGVHDPAKRRENQKKRDEAYERRQRQADRRRNERVALECFTDDEVQLFAEAAERGEKLWPLLKAEES